MNEVREKLAAFPGMRVSVQNISLIGGGGFRQTPFNLILRGPDLGAARAATPARSSRPSRPRAASSTSTPPRPSGSPRSRCTSTAARPRTWACASTPSPPRSGPWSGGEKVGFYREGGEQYDVRLRLREGHRTDASVLSTLTVPGAGGTLVKLANVTDLGQGMSPGQIERYAQERSITVISNLLPAKPLAEAFREAYGAVAAQRMPPGVRHPDHGAGQAAPGVAPELHDRVPACRSPSSTSSSPPSSSPSSTRSRSWCRCSSRSRSACSRSCSSARPSTSTRSWGCSCSWAW